MKTEIRDGQIWLGENLLVGHGCTSMEEMQEYCEYLNEQNSRVTKPKSNVKLDPKSVREILEILEDGQ